jgi:hypothetical protein
MSHEIDTSVQGMKPLPREAMLDRFGAQAGREQLRTGHNSVLGGCDS